MPRNLTESVTYTTPISVPENGEPVAAETRDPAFQGLANRTAWLKGVVQGTQTIDAVTREITKSAVEFSWVIESGSDVIPPFKVSAGGAHGLEFDNTNDNVRLYLALNRLLPLGASSVEADLLVTPAASQSAPGQLEIMRADASSIWDTPAAPAYVVNDTDSTSGSAHQKLTVVDSVGALNNNNLGLLSYTPGTITSGVHRVWAVRLRFTDPGPRNY